MQHDLYASEQILTFNLTLTPSNSYQVKPTSIQSISTFNLTSKSIIPLRKSKIPNLKSIIEKKKKKKSIQITTDRKKKEMSVSLLSFSSGQSTFRGLLISDAR